MCQATMVVICVQNDVALMTFSFTVRDWKSRNWQLEENYQFVDAIHNFIKILNETLNRPMKCREFHERVGKMGCDWYIRY